MVPAADFFFRKGDIGYFVIKTEDVENLLELTEKPIIETHRVMIIGGSKIGRTLAREFQRFNKCSFSRIQSTKSGKNISKY